MMKQKKKMYKKRYISPEDKKRYIFPEEKKNDVNNDV